MRGWKKWLTCPMALLSLALLAGAGARPSVTPATAKTPDPSPSRSSRPSLLLITIDTWRWDYIGASGSGKVETPVLDNLAKEGIYEREAVTPYPLTTPAHASLFTGLYPMTHGVLDCLGYSLRPGLETLAQAFRSGGYSTAAFLSGEPLLRRFGLDRGFQVYDDSGVTKPVPDDWVVGNRDGAVTTAAALQYVRGLKGAPAFLWVHYFDPHQPYRARPAMQVRYPRDPYAQQVAFVDDQVGQLLAECRKGGDWRAIVVGDHGEGLGEHGEGAHGIALYRATVHVPLVLHPKPASPLVHSKPWNLVDLDPTVREWFGLPPGKGQDGESLFGKGRPDRAMPLLSLLPTFTFYVSPSMGIRKGAFSYLRFDAEELYDLGADPNQARNLAKAGADAGAGKILAELRSECDRAFPQDRLQGLLAPTVKATGAEMDSLAGLGYLGGFTPQLSAVQRADLKSVLADNEAMGSAREKCFAKKDWGPLKTTYEALLRKYPRAPSLQSNYGKLCLRLGDYASATRAFECVVKVNPRDVDALINLGTLYIQQGKLERARALLEAAVAENPDDPQGQKNLGLLYNDYLKQPEKAIPHFKRYIEIEPRSPDALKMKAYIERYGMPKASSR